MGMTFSTIQIKKPRQVGPEQVVQVLRGYMEQKGFISVPKEDAQFSCRIAVSAYSDWATLSYNEYAAGEYFGRIKEDAQNLAETLETDFSMRIRLSFARSSKSSSIPIISPERPTIPYSQAAA